MAAPIFVTLINKQLIFYYQLLIFNYHATSISSTKVFYPQDGSQAGGVQAGSLLFRYPVHARRGRSDRQESSLTKGDVLNVLDRYQRYVIKNLQKGYKVELLGFGTVYNRFVTEKGVATAPEVKATHIRTIVPGFSPSYTILNGARRYSLLGEKTSLLKVTILGTPVEEGGGSDSESPDEI